MSDQDKPVFTIDEMSNDLRENEGLYEAEFKQMQEIADIQFGDGSQTIMDIEWLEGRTETERLVEIDRLDAVLNARGEKIDALMSAESARAEREAKHPRTTRSNARNARRWDPRAASGICKPTRTDDRQWSAPQWSRSNPRFSCQAGNGH